ncbi:MAG: hypothetical protein ACE148_15285 [Vicinamibacterales bacterium]
MIPGIPQADPLPLPAPPWLLAALLVVTFLLHVLPMNFALGGSIMGAVARLRARDGLHPHHAALASWIGKALPIVMAAAVTAGVAALLFLQALFGRLFFTSSVLIAWPWFSVVVLLLAAYGGAYALGSPSPRSRERLCVALAVPAALLVVGFIYSNNMSLMLRPAVFVAMYRSSGSGFHLNLADPVLLPRFLHATTGAIAVTGLSVALYGLWSKSRVRGVFRETEGHDGASAAGTHGFSRWAIAWGSRWFVAATAVNVVFGTWWLIALPTEILLGTMGEALGLTLSLAGGILFAIAAFGLVMMAVKADSPGGPLIGAAGSLVAAILMMILTRDQIRKALLEAAGYVPIAWTATQWGPLLIFLGLLVGATVAVVWMVRVLVKARHRGDVQAA